MAPSTATLATVLQAFLSLFTVLETFTSRERGALDLYSLVSWLVCFKFSIAYVFQRWFSVQVYPRGGISSRLRKYDCYYTPAYVAYGHDWPSGNGAGHWPYDLAGAGLPPYNNMSFPSLDTFFTALRSNAFLNNPYTFPIYSNSGYILLGILNTLAEAHQANRTSPLSHVELVNRDIFQPLGLSGSSFYVTEENKDHVAVSFSMSWKMVCPFYFLRDNYQEHSTIHLGSRPGDIQS